jgi:catechol 2,3-dioxygenase-like lactoylglutathione lyase family enzyme
LAIPQPSLDPQQSGWRHQNQEAHRGEIIMNGRKRIACACALFASPVLAAPALAGDAPAPPRAPIRTALGTSDHEVLLAKFTVSDLEKSYAFYTQVIGLRRALTPMQGTPPPPRNDPERAFIEIGLNFSGSYGDAFFDLVQQKGVRPSPEFARSAVIGFKVPDAPAVVRRARAAGYEVVREAPVVGPGEMSIGMVRDPDGYLVELIQSASMPAR